MSPGFFPSGKHTGTGFRSGWGWSLACSPIWARPTAGWPAPFPLTFSSLSQHLVEGADPYYPEYWQGRREEEVYRRYFETVLRNIPLHGRVRHAGHLDYIVRYGPNRNRFYSFRAYEDVITPILQELIRRDKCLEVNTAGLKYGLGHPTRRRMCCAGIGSWGDAGSPSVPTPTKPEHIAWEFQKAEKILLDLGFTHYTVFQNRIPLELASGALTGQKVRVPGGFAP